MTKQRPYAGVSPRAILSDTSQEIICFALDVSGIVQASIASISCHSRYPPGPRFVGQHRVSPGLREVDPNEVSVTQSRQSPEADPLECRSSKSEYERGQIHHDT